MIKKTTIQDVAKKAGVSTATVSRVLSNNGYPVSKKLKEKIQRAVDELNYVPNLLGKQLKTNNNNTIGVIIPSISNPFYSTVMQGVEEIARKNKHHVLLCNTLQDQKVEEEYINTLIQKQIKGLIISSISSNPALLNRIADMGIKIVAIDQKIDSDNIAQIEFDYRKGGYMATRYLISKDHSKIAYVTAPLDRPSRKSIYQGYLDAMKEAGLTVLKDWVQEAAREDQVNDNLYEFNNGVNLANHLLALPETPTAVFCCNDMTAIGVSFELTRLGIKVPDDLSLIGFDDIPFASMVTPPLTTIKQPDYEMGKLACNMLFEMMFGEGNKDTMNIMLQPKLIERVSVRQLPVAIERNT